MTLVKVERISKNFGDFSACTKVNLRDWRLNVPLTCRGTHFEGGGGMLATRDRFLQSRYCKGIMPKRYRLTLIFLGFRLDLCMLIKHSCSFYKYIIHFAGDLQSVLNSEVSLITRCRKVKVDRIFICSISIVPISDTQRSFIYSFDSAYFIIKIVNLSYILLRYIKKILLTLTSIA